MEKVIERIGMIDTSSELFLVFENLPNDQALLDLIINTGYPKKKITLFFPVVDLENNLMVKKAAVRDKALNMGVKFLSNSIPIPLISGVLCTSSFVDIIKERASTSDPIYVLKSEDLYDNIQTLYNDFLYGNRIDGEKLLIEFERPSDSITIYRPFISTPRVDIYKYIKDKNLLDPRYVDKVLLKSNPSIYKLVDFLSSDNSNYHNDINESIIKIKSDLSELYQSSYALPLVHSKLKYSLRDVGAYTFYLDWTELKSCGFQRGLTTGLDFTKTVHRKAVIDLFYNTYDITISDDSLVKAHNLFKDGISDGDNVYINCGDNDEYCLTKSGDKYHLVKNSFYHLKDYSSVPFKNCNYLLNDDDIVVFRNKQKKFSELCVDYDVPFFIKSKVRGFKIQDSDLHFMDDMVFTTFIDD